MRFRLLTILSLLLCSSLSHAGVIAIIIDDIGYGTAPMRKVLKLHPALVPSILPNAPNSDQSYNLAMNDNREVMLHIPMESLGNLAAEPDTLRLGMTESHFKAQIYNYLARFPAVSGMNNHMGSLLTTKDEPMQWMMEALSQFPDQYFVDSRTHGKTVAAAWANTYAIPSAERKVFLDAANNQKEEFIRKQIRQLGREASREGFAIGIGHPFKTTLSALRAELPKLEAKGHEIVTVSEFIDRQSSGNLTAYNTDVQ